MLGDVPLGLGWEEGWKVVCSGDAKYNRLSIGGSLSGTRDLASGAVGAGAGATSASSWSCARDSEANCARSEWRSSSAYDACWAFLDCNGACEGALTEAAAAVAAAAATALAASANCNGSGSARKVLAVGLEGVDDEDDSDEGEKEEDERGDEEHDSDSDGRVHTKPSASADDDDDEADEQGAAPTALGAPEPTTASSSFKIRLLLR